MNLTKRSFSITDKITIGEKAPLVIMAGPCVIENIDTCRKIADTMAEGCARENMHYIFKASFDKANRTSGNSYRGPGLEQGLEILAEIKSEFSVPIITDIHEPTQAAQAAAVADVLQIPAFLCRQTDLLAAAAVTGRPVNVKKGQFLAPEDMAAVLEKLTAAGSERNILTERGASFGYHNLVVDMRGLVIMRELGAPVVFDATHAVQLPGGRKTSSGGQREFVYPLSRAALAVGIDGLFIEVHPEPEKALSDGANSLPLNEIQQLLSKAKEIHELAP